MRQLKIVSSKHWLSGTYNSYTELWIHSFIKLDLEFRAAFYVRFWNIFLGSESSNHDSVHYIVILLCWNIDTKFWITFIFHHVCVAWTASPERSCTMIGQLRQSVHVQLFFDSWLVAVSLHSSESNRFVVCTCSVLCRFTIRSKIWWKIQTH